MSDNADVRPGSLLYATQEPETARLHHNMQVSELFGHEEAERQFLDAWTSGRLPHGWLLSGPKGVGKMTLACRFARFVLANPDQPGSGPPGLFDDLPPDLPRSLDVPHDHPAARRAATGGHGDLHILERRIQNNRQQSAILVDTVRAGCQALFLTSAEGGWRVVIIDDAETMNESAFNALLKVLEEPPSRSLLILVAHAAGRLPATVRSRCCKIKLSPLPLEMIGQILTRYRPALSVEDREDVAALCEGSIGLALRLCDGNGPEIWRDLIEFLSGLPANDHVTAQKFASRFSAGNDDGSNWEIASLLVGRCLATLVSAAARKKPMEDLGYGTRDASCLNSLLNLASLDCWLDLWEKTQLRFQQVSEFNLDKRQAMLDVLAGMAESTNRRT